MKYRKKPIVIEAERYCPPYNCRAVWAFLGWEWNEDNPEAEFWHDPESCHHDLSVFIQTKEGLMEAEAGDWIIKGVEGEFYPCKPSIFDATYDAVWDG